MKFIIGKQVREVSVDGLTYEQFNDLEPVMHFKAFRACYPFQVAHDTYSVTSSDYAAFIWSLKWYFQNYGLCAHKIVINGRKYKVEK